MSRARTLARRLGLERQALAVRRAFLPAHVRADIRDHELIIALLERILEPDSDCLDVGAHSGSVLREMVRLSPMGRHVAWEPLPAHAEQLRREFPAVDVRQAALADSSGEADFQHALDEPGWSGFRARPTPGSSSFERLTVKTERLDESLPVGVVPAVIKIDVEGAEEAVLRGAVTTLHRFQPAIVFEHARGGAEQYGTTPEALHDLLVGDLGYRIEGLDGDGPYDRARFADIFASGERYNFAAWPDRD
ncbi:MAG TPA: FkbM family methyltransferase [Candidatus Limnocylindrales bacterium]|nr:FkbM family methyltransferase [Candidatus Limnocylindrales bacterium]